MFTKKKPQTTRSKVLENRAPLMRWHNLVQCFPHVCVIVSARAISHLLIIKYVYDLYINLISIKHLSFFCDKCAIMYAQYWCLLLCLIFFFWFFEKDTRKNGRGGGGEIGTAIFFKFVVFCFFFPLITAQVEIERSCTKTWLMHTYFLFTFFRIKFYLFVIHILFILFLSFISQWKQ